MKKLITMTFEMVPDEHHAFETAFGQLKSLLDARNVQSSLYRDLSRANRFMLTFHTESTLDEITQLIQEDAAAKQCFEQMKETESRIVISAMEQVL
jgi:hypothetical protein